MVGLERMTIFCEFSGCNYANSWYRLSVCAPPFTLNDAPPFLVQALLFFVQIEIIESKNLNLNLGLFFMFK